MVFSLVLTGYLSSSPSLHTLSYFFIQPSRLYSSLPTQICCYRIFQHHFINTITKVKHTLDNLFLFSLLSLCCCCCCCCLLVLLWKLLWQSLYFYISIELDSVCIEGRHYKSCPKAFCRYLTTLSHHTGLPKAVVHLIVAGYHRCIVVARTH